MIFYTCPFRYFLFPTSSNLQKHLQKIEHTRQSRGLVRKYVSTLFRAGLIVTEMISDPHDPNGHNCSFFVSIDNFKIFESHKPTVSEIFQPSFHIHCISILSERFFHFLSKRSSEYRLFSSVSVIHQSPSLTSLSVQPPLSSSGPKFANPARSNAPMKEALGRVQQKSAQQAQSKNTHRGKGQERKGGRGIPVKRTPKETSLFRRHPNTGTD